MKELGFLVDVGLAGGLVQGVEYSSAVYMGRWLAFMPL